MFGAVMCEPENCRPFLEMALGFPIRKLTVSKERSLVYHPEYKGVRLDVEARDEHGTLHNIEMQVAPKPFLARRARYYHSQMDMELLARGGDYGSLPDSYVIFVCDFDPFGYGKYRYTFRNLCLEESGFALRDGQTTMFLSTCGKNPEEVPESLVSFLKYIGLGLQESTKDSDDGYVRQLQAAVRQVKESREMGARYMIFREMLEEQREAGFSEGKAEGKAEDVLDLLQELPGRVPEELKERIFAERDLMVLKRYHRLAASAESVEEFIQRISHTEQS